MNLKFHQVAFVVKDLDAAVKYWADILGIRPWNIWTMTGEKIHDTKWGGKQTEFGIRHALAWVGEQQFELVQPLHGQEMFADQLSEMGDGFSHIGAIVPDHEAAILELENRGFVVLQSARFGESADGRFAYLRHPDYPVVIEVILPPTKRYEPDYIYPKEP